MLVDNIQYIEVLKNSATQLQNNIYSQKVEDIYREDDAINPGCLIVTGAAYVTGFLFDRDNPTELGEMAEQALESNHLCENSGTPEKVYKDAPVYMPNNSSTYLGGLNGNSKPSVPSEHCNGLSYNASSC